MIIQTACTSNVFSSHTARVGHLRQKFFPIWQSYTFTWDMSQKILLKNWIQKLYFKRDDTIWDVMFLVSTSFNFQDISYMKIRVIGLQITGPPEMPISSSVWSGMFIGINRVRTTFRSWGIFVISNDTFLWLKQIRTSFFLVFTANRYWLRHLTIPLNRWGYSCQLSLVIVGFFVLDWVTMLITTERRMVP